MSTIPEPEQARPWIAGRDGPWPQVWTWPHHDRPALEVWARGQWRPAPVIARQNWANGATYYQVEVDLHEGTGTQICMYRWPQPGLRAGHGSSSAPSTTAHTPRLSNTPPPRPRRRD